MYIDVNKTRHYFSLQSVDVVDAAENTKQLASFFINGLNNQACFRETIILCNYLVNIDLQNLRNVVQVCPH